MIESIKSIDFTILDTIQSTLRSDIMDSIMKFITTLGNAGIVWILIALVLVFIKRYRLCGIAMLAGLVSGVLIGNVILKNLIMRDRPCWINDTVQLLIELPDDYSFPSGHTLASFIAAVILLRHSKAMGIPALILAVLIAFSRLYLYVHFPTDILGGIALAIAIGICADVCAAKIADRISNKASPQVDSE